MWDVRSGIWDGATLVFIAHHTSHISHRNLFPEGGDALVRFHSQDPGILLYLVRIRSG
jgi:hypothetical protein